MSTQAGSPIIATLDALVDQDVEGFSLTFTVQPDDEQGATRKALETVLRGCLVGIPAGIARTPATIRSWAGGSPRVRSLVRCYVRPSDADPDTWVSEGEMTASSPAEVDLRTRAGGPDLTDRTQALLAARILEELAVLGA